MGRYGFGLTLLFFISLQAVQVIITPISHYTVGMIGGFLFGPFIGGVVNYVGRLIGHSCAFFISRKWGRNIIEKFVDEAVILRYDKILSGDPKSGQISVQSMILFLVYFLPLFPDDEVSYLVGASKMPTKLFILANIFGHLGGAFSLAYIGSGIDTRDVWFWFLFIITLIGFPIIWILLRIASKNS